VRFVDDKIPPAKLLQGTLLRNRHLIGGDCNFKFPGHQFLFPQQDLKDKQRLVWMLSGGWPEETVPALPYRHETWSLESRDTIDGTHSSNWIGLISEWWLGAAHECPVHGASNPAPKLFEVFCRGPFSFHCKKKLKGCVCSCEEGRLSTISSAKIPLIPFSYSLMSQFRPRTW